MKKEDVTIIPAQTAHSARWNQEHSYLAIALEPEAFNQQLVEVLRGQTTSNLWFFKTRQYQFDDC